MSPSLAHTGGCDIGWSVIDWHVSPFQHIHNVFFNIKSTQVPVPIEGKALYFSITNPRLYVPLYLDLQSQQPIRPHILNLFYRFSRIWLSICLAHKIIGFQSERTPRTCSFSYFRFNCVYCPVCFLGITAANTIYSVWFNLFVRPNLPGLHFWWLLAIGPPLHSRWLFLVTRCFRYTPIHIHICKASASYPALPSCLLQ